jgi:hypothetical protein
MIALEAAFALSLSPLRTKCSGWWLRFKDGDAEANRGSSCAAIGLRECEILKKTQGILVGSRFLNHFSLIAIFKFFLRFRLHLEFWIKSYKHGISVNKLQVACVDSDLAPEVHQLKDSRQPVARHDL